ncbi:MAG: PHB depolymerase family esterase [Steroidobacteraceae bacterium]|jgi:poly(hydroxyalkanoate) depolymerase family esterase
MLGFLRAWFKRKFGRNLRQSPGTPATAETPVSARPPGRSRFLVRRFNTSVVTALLRRSPTVEIAYRLYLPSGSSPRDGLPLIVMLHGCKQDALSFAEGTRMNALAEEGRYAVLYPEQSERANPLRCWNWFEAASQAGHGEAALLARLIENVTQRRPIDPRRVFVVGMSAGGAMACVLAVRHSRLFAACAIHSGVMFGVASSPIQALSVMRSGPSPASIDKARRLQQEAVDSDVFVPTLVIHGDDDTIVNPVNSEQLVEQLKRRAEIIAPASGALIASGERHIASAGHAYRQQDYLQAGRPVLRQIVVEGLGHAWSGGDERFDFNDAAAPDAGRLILEFAAHYHREAPTQGVARTA